MIDISRNGWNLHLVQDSQDLDAVVLFFHSIQKSSLVGLGFIKDRVVGVCLSAFTDKGILYNLQSFDLVDFVESKDIKDPLIGRTLKSTLGVRFSVGSSFIMSDTPCVYEIRNVKNNRHYVGSTVDFERRKLQHLYRLRRNSHENFKLRRDWSFYEEEAFVFSVLEEVEDKTKLIEREQFWMDSTAPYYNICQKAYSTFGVKPSKESRIKTAERNKTRVWTDEMRRNSSQSAKRRFSSDSRLREAFNHKGVTLSKEHKASFCKGRKHTEDWADIMRSKLGLPVIQLSIDGGFLAEFPLASALEVLGFNPSIVQDCCRGKQKTHKGFKFIYKKDYTSKV